VGVIQMSKASTNDDLEFDKKQEQQELKTF
jgi:hypothetical protein